MQCTSVSLESYKKCSVSISEIIYRPDGRDEALDGVWDSAGVACQDGPCGGVFGVDDEGAGGL